MRYKFLLVIAVFVLSLTSGILAQDKPAAAPWLDSLSSTAAADGEHDLQYYLDSLGYDIDVDNDELGLEVFCGLPGVNTATMMIEVAGSAVYATSGYYRAGDNSMLYQLFGPYDGPGDSVQFNFSITDSIGFYMKPNLPGEWYTWYTETDMNYDHFDHAKVFSTGNPHEFLVCFEDLPNGGDADYQDLVIKIRFSNQIPYIEFTGSTDVVLCSSESVCFNLNAIDDNCQGDSIWVSMISGEGSFTPLAGVAQINTTHCFSPTVSGVYEFVFEVEDELGAVNQDTFTVNVSVANAPTVELNDSTLALCSPEQICLPVSISDPDCDIVSVTSNIGSYSGNASDFDQIGRLNEMGGTVTQVNGGDNGKILYEASDFVPPVNSQSGVSVTLPNFTFADFVASNGSFPTGAEPGNHAVYMLGAPTDLTYTLVGPGGPDGGDGDGSVKFNYHNYVILGFNQDITTCNGASIDFMIFTNTSTGGHARLYFYDITTTVYSMNVTIPSAATGSGTGGVTIDLPDGLTFNRVRIRNMGGCFDIDAIAARTAPSPTSTDLCFMADTAGTYEIIVTATDDCGNVGADTANFTVQINQPPVADAGPDQTLFVCNFSEICLPVTLSDPNGNLDYTELYSGPGTLNASQICFTPASEGVFTFVIHAVDECGLEDFDTVAVTISSNDPPVAEAPSTVNKFLCEAGELCHTFTAVDPNGGTLNWTKLSGPGTLSTAGEFCFTPAGAGSYVAEVVVTDSCGATDTTSITYNITINSAPVANDPTTPVDVSQCDPEEICYQFTAADADGGPLGWTQLSGDGTVSAGGQWCFTPTGSGTYTATVEVADTCGAADTTALTYNVTVNDPPTITLVNDTTLALCSPQEICLGYDIDDPQGTGSLTVHMDAGFGTLDEMNQEVCFTPTVAGVYEFILTVTDDCDVTDTDTVTVTVSFGEGALISCPGAPIDVSLCSADSVCQQIDITPGSATVTVSHGIYDNGELCFYADTSGTYEIQVIAEAECGADTCDVTFNVDIGQAAQINCPAPFTKFICTAQSVCVPVGVMGSGATITVSPIGAYNAGNVCFTADTSGHYEITVIAATECGSDTCVVTADITINSHPVAVDPTSPVDTFLCQFAQICYQFEATDVDGGALTWSRLSGNGTVTAGGEWCFNASATGTYTVTARVADSCGAADTVSMTYNVTKNTAPVITLGNDTTIFLCVNDHLCLPFDTSDVDGNIQAVDVFAGTATISGTNFCFDATTEGTFQFILRVTDECGAIDKDTINVTIEKNSSPVADAGADLTIFQCSPQEICWNAGATDPDNNLVTVEMITGPGTFDGTQICFTPTGTLNYEFVIKATDACGLVSYDTMVVYYTLNSAPVASAGADQTLELCTPQQICWAASCSDVNGNLASCLLTEGPGTYDGSQICFTPTASGSYTFVLEATDDCGLIDYDTAIINVTLNSAPVCTVPNDTSIFQCTAAEVCLPAFATDADGNLDYCQIISGPGTLTGGNWCYTPTASQTVTVTMRCVDDCGAECVSDFTVEFEINGKPSIAFGPDLNEFLCDAEEICLPYTSSDPNDPRPTTITLEAGPGTLDEANSQVCFTPASDGNYQFILKIEDECGRTDFDTINVDVSINTPPVASAGSDDSFSLCAPQEICWAASCSDVDGNLTDCNFNGPGTYDGNQICFTPPASGTYTFTLQATDACGETMTDTVEIDITLNSPPTVAFGADMNEFLCTATQICVDYTVDDPDGLTGLTETMISGYGTIDTAANQVCFMASAAGSYEIVVRATDPCGQFDEDTIVVNVTFGTQADIDCPTGPIDVFLCNADDVCQMIDITPSTATVTTSFGTYSGGELCFTADTSGTYVIDISADSDCGSDNCTVTFNVTIGEQPQISCPSPSSKFICDPGQVCIPVGVMGGGATVTVSPIGSYNGSHLCFTADTAGHYEIEMIATTTCGADTCEVVVDVDMNSNPIADDPTSPVDTFLCASDQICYQFTATDGDGGPLTWQRQSGNGTVDAAGLWCFNANASGSFTVMAEVADTCGAADTTSLTYNVTLNGPPTITMENGGQINVFQCISGEICFTYTTADPDDNITLEELIDGSGTLDDVNNEVCFTPAGPGTYDFIVKVTDECGVFDQDTMRVIVAANTAPVASINNGTDIDLFQCNPTELCMPAVCTDADNNLTACEMILGAGTYDGSQICFTPDTAGVYTFILRATDDCGQTDEDTITATIHLNSPPVCDIPNDTTFFQCSPEKVTLPVTATDVDGNFDHCEIITGPGSIVGGNWEYTPTTDQSVKVKIMCLDACGASCIDSFNVNFEINADPVVNAGPDTTFFLCNAQQVCIPITAADEDNNLDLVELVSSVGTFDEQLGRFCIDVTYGQGNDRSYTAIFKATDECGAFDYDTVVIHIDFNTAPTVDLPPDFVAYLDEVGELCFDATIEDEDDNLTGITVSPIGTYDEMMHKICFDADSTGQYCLTVTATDNCGAQMSKEICIDVEVDECIHVQIEKVHDAFQGGMTDVNIFLNGSGKELGGYDFMICYEAGILLPITINPGSLIEDCGWEYFNYNQGPFGTCGGGCPTGMLEVVAVAETNNGAYHPGCFLDGQVGSLTTIQFLVTNDRNYECQYIPIKFYWMNCSDNSLSSRYGDTLWISRNVFDFELTNITDNSYGFPGYFGAPDECLEGDKTVPIRCVDFINGGVDIVCADSIDARGDINLDGIPYTIADAVMLTNYFIKGLSALVYVTNPSETGYEASIAASEVNGDGIPLTVADLVYLIRTITGDVAGLPKFNPNANFEAIFDMDQQTLIVEHTDAAIGAVHLVIEGEATPVLDEDIKDMEMRSYFDGNQTRVIIYNMKGKQFLEAGSIVTFDRPVTISEIEIGSANGFVMTAKWHDQLLPEDFELRQNYPNPFNPTTTIEFALPIASDWRLTVYNILGQVVETWSDESPAGYQKVEWDAQRFASGVYFYRLEAGSFKATKKMVLLK